MTELKDKYNNGEIPQSSLVKLDTGQSLEKSAAQSFVRMKSDAAKQNIDIQLVGKFSGYRPCGQKGDYNQGLSNGQFTQWYAWEKYKAGKGNLAANPTTSKGCKSNHGWGRAIDVKGSKAKKWIKDNGVPYGWVWYTKDGGEGEKAKEDWHFTYVNDKDTFEKKGVSSKKKGGLAYVFLGVAFVGLAYGFYFATRTKK